MSLDRTAKIISFSEYASFLELTMQRVPALAKARGATGRRGRLQTRFDSGLPTKKRVL